jgi:hypothetical protein
MLKKKEKELKDSQEEMKKKQNKGCCEIMWEYIDIGNALKCKRNRLMDDNIIFTLFTAYLVDF